MHRWLAVLIAGVFLAYTAATALTQVQPGERAVVRRFGRILPDVPGPGLYLGWPWGIDRVERIAVGRVRRVTIGYVDKQGEDVAGTPTGQLLTGDHNLVNVQVEIHYTINDAEVHKFFLQSQRAPDLVGRTAEAALAEWIAGRNIDDVLLRGKALLPAALVGEVQTRLAAYDLGVTVEAASVTRLNPPDEVREAFERVAQAQTAIQTQLNAAAQSANRREREAEAEMFRMKRLAGAYGQEQRLQAQADAESFSKRLGQYRELSKSNPHYLNTLWLDEMTAIYARMRASGRIDLLDHYLTGEGLSIVQFPPLPKKK
jgi:membrane protease subunit HflK